MDLVATLNDAPAPRLTALEELLNQRLPKAITVERYRTVARKGGAVSVVRDDKRGTWVEMGDIEALIEWGNVCQKQMAAAHERTATAERVAELATSVRKKAADTNGHLRDVLKACYLSDCVSAELKAKILEIL